MVIDIVNVWLYVTLSSNIISIECDVFKWLKAWFSQRESVQKLSTNITIESSLDKTISRAEDLKVLSTLLQFTPGPANLLCTYCAIPR